MYFSEEAINSLAADYAAMAGKRDQLVELFITRTYQVPRAKEFAEHGISRRIGTMAHCIENVFDTLPPERGDHPSTEELIDAVVYIQAFIFNAFACLDNLAWIWVCERKLTKDNGEPVPNAMVGLGRKCKVVRRSLPSDLRKHLKTLDAWFEHMESFRHALAHRIPLYVPPCVIAHKDVEKYELLEKQKSKASRRGNIKRYEELSAAQRALTAFEPIMMHSIPDDSKRIVFHPQILSDFNTICELGQRMHAALDVEPEAIVAGRFWAMVLNGWEKLSRLGRAIVGR